MLLGTDSVPRGLVELQQYFRIHGPIQFCCEKQDDGSFVFLSHNFRYGSIITSVKRLEDTNAQIADAILTAFSVPSSYAAEAGIHRVGEQEYAPA